MTLDQLTTMEDKYKIRIAVSEFMGWRNKPIKNNPHVYVYGKNLMRVRTYHDLPPYESCMRSCNQFEFVLYSRSIVNFLRYVDELNKEHVPKDVHPNYAMAFNCLLSTPLQRCKALLAVI